MTAFPLSLAIVFAAIVLCAAWLTRTATAPTWAKILVWSLGLAGAVYVPFAANALSGRPVETSYGQLPHCFYLAAYFAHEGEAGTHETRVELWLVEDGTPRAYGVLIPSEAYDGLQDARAALVQAPYVRLCKEQPLGAPTGDRLDGEGASGGFEIDPEWFAKMRKGG